MGLEETYKELLGRLHRLRLKSKNVKIAYGLSTFLLFLLGFAAMLLVLEALFHFASEVRLGLIITFVMASIFMLSWQVVLPLYARFCKPRFPDEVSLSLEIGRSFTKIRDKLADAIQVYQNKKQNAEGYSTELADESLLRVFQETRGLDFLAVLDPKPLKRLFRFLCLAAALFAGIFILFSAPFSAASHRLLNPSRDFADRPHFSIEVFPGNSEVVRGETVTISAKPSHLIAQKAVLWVRSTDAVTFDSYRMKQQGATEFSLELPDVRSEKVYFVEVGDQKSEQFTLSVIDRPYVRALQVGLISPSYSGLGRTLLDENIGDVTALKGTRVELNMETNKSVAEARVVFDDTSEVIASVSGTQVAAIFRVMRPGSYHVFLKDKEGLSNANPIAYRISIVEDLLPAVQIVFPGQDVDLSKDLLLPLTIEGQDDFGISKLRLGFRILRQGLEEGDLRFVDLDLPKGNPDKLLSNHVWDMKELEITPQDVVAYFAEVFDNDSVSGPKAARSETFQARFPSIQELYDDVKASQQSAVDELAQLYEESKSLKQTVDEIVHEMKREPDLNWEEKQKVQEATSGQSQIQEQLQELQESLDNMVQNMEQNELISPETLNKYQELQSLIEEMLTPEMRETLEALEESMDELNPEELREAMEKVAASQEDFLKGMERTLNLLKKLQTEQKLDESITKAQDLLRRQQELNQQVSESPREQSGKKYAEEQDAIRQDTESLADELQQLQEAMKEFPQMPQEEVGAVQNKLQEGVSPQMQQASTELQQGKMQSANQKGQQASQSLREAVDALQQAQEQMSEEEKKRIMQALRRSSHDLLNLSKQQEALMEETQGADRNTPGINDMADKQQDLASGLNRVTSQLYDLSQSTFFVTPDVGKALGKASGGMQESLQGLESRDPGKSAKNQQNAMAGLNEAVSSLRNSMQSMSGAQSGIGFDEMMQRMLGMSGQQQQINQQTSQLGQQGGLSPQQQAEAGRLAREQAAVRKSLQQLMQEAGNNSDLLGDLNQVSKDMEDVVKELMNFKVDRPTQERQQQILSRLLDAQRSMQDRDYSKKRKAETGKTYEVASPLPLRTQANNKDDLRNELLKAMKESYSKDYKDLIQKYFEALAERDLEREPVK